MTTELNPLVKEKLSSFLNPSPKEVQRIRNSTPSFDQLQGYIHSNMDMQHKGERYFPDPNFHLDRLISGGKSIFSLEGTELYKSTIWRITSALTDSDGNIVSRSETRKIIINDPRYYFSSYIKFDRQISINIFYPGGGITYENGQANFYTHESEPLSENEITVKMRELLELALESKYLNSGAIFEDSVF